MGEYIIEIPSLGRKFCYTNQEKMFRKIDVLILTGIQFKLKKIIYLIDTTKS